MSTISSMPSSIVTWLSGRSELSSIKFLTEYPAKKKAVPLKRTTVAVGIKSIEILDATEENDEDDVLEDNEYCRNAVITLRLSIHAPYSSGGVACHQAFADIIDCLTFDSDLDITTSGCDSISEDRDTDAFVLTAHITISANMCPAAETTLDFPSFTNKTLLCGSHITNQNIHLTATQKQRLDQPYVSGRYTGTGTATREVSIGFSPSEVTVVAEGMAPMTINAVNSGSSSATTYNESYLGFALASGGSMGVEITTTGFKVYNGDSYALYGSKPMMNKSGLTYVYLCRR